MSNPPRVDRLGQTLRDSSQEPAWNALDEAVLAAARNQASINLQRSKKEVKEPKRLWWQRWDLAAGAGSLATVLATVLLVTADPEQEQGPVASAPVGATAPATSSPMSTPTTGEPKAEVSANTSASPKPNVQSNTVESRRSQNDSAPVETKKSRPSTNVAKATVDSSPTSALRPTAQQESVASPAPTAPTTQPAPIAENSVATVPAPTPAPSTAPAIQSRTAPAAASSRTKMDSPRLSTVEACERMLSSFPLELRVMANTPWLNAARQCKKQFPEHSWPESVGPISEVIVQP